METQKIMFAFMLAVVALVVTGATAASFSPTPAHADKPSYCKGNDCYTSKKQCEKRSPGKSGEAQCD
jgi:hypothetical protein